MNYTVKQLATMSGVSVRTLHWYDEKDILKPAFIAENGYRFYTEEQVLRLQQILFYKELGFSLERINVLVAQEDFDKIKALEMHRNMLNHDIDHKQSLIDTIDKTLNYLRGESTMQNLSEIFDGFTDELQQHYLDYLEDEAGVPKQTLDDAHRKAQKFSKQDWLRHKAAMDAIHHQLVEALERGLLPESAEVQKIMPKHYQQICLFWTPDREKYIGLSEMYGSHPDFVRFYDNIHPELLAFLQQAMCCYAQQLP